MTASTIHVLGELRHACRQCGGSCQGIYVRLTDPEEEERLVAQAATLGVTDPIVDQRLRLVGGQCVFLDDKGLCRIHAEFGGDQKPAVCQQYPMIATRVDEGVRVGLDPGCYAGLATFQKGPEVADRRLVSTAVSLPGEQIGYEEAFLDLCSLEDLRIPHLLGALSGEPAPANGGLQPGFTGRWITCLQRADLGPLLELDDTAPMIRGSLTVVTEAINTWDPTAPPAWPAISPEEEAWAIDVAQRMIFLRLAHQIPIVAGVALLTLGGAIACGWATKTPDDFGNAMAAWTRAIRARTFWSAITPDANVMGWLARGDGSPSQGN